MNAIDYGVIAAYLGALLLFGYALRKQSGEGDYFLGGRSMGWFPLTLSTMATQLSAISFVSAPAFVGLRENGWHRWFHKHRVPADTAAAMITHPWESGRDNSAEWDEPAAAIDVSAVKPYRRRDLQHTEAEMRPTKLDYDRYLALVDFGRNNGWNHEFIAKHGPFQVADVGMTMILLRANRDLAHLAEDLGHNEARRELEGYIAQLEAGVDYLWDEGAQAYCSRDVRTGRHSGLLTNASFLCYYADVGSPDQRRQMERHWKRISQAAAYMVPSHDPDDPKFNAVRYWRGPVWIVVNYMLARGFEESGLAKWAARVRMDSRRLIGGHGFREAYSPHSGAGSGGDDFSWTAAMWLAWCGDSSRRPG